MDNVKINRALISVSDKSGIIELCKALQKLGVELLSTGGTYRLLRDNDVDVIEVSEYTGFPEMMDGRVKTLHPKIHGGLLGRRNADGSGPDVEVMSNNDISAIDLVVVNLYPFEEAVARPDCDLATAIENIDIGGPSMVRSAAKNYQSVATLMDIDDYERVVHELEANNGSLSGECRFKLAVKAFQVIAGYDAAISTYLGTLDSSGKNIEQLPDTMTLHFEKAQELRYGENPHQQAAFYRQRGITEANVSTARQIQGKELSFNNIADTDAALECAKSFTDPACVIATPGNRPSMLSR